MSKTTDKIQDGLKEAAADKTRPNWLRILAWLGWIAAAGVTAIYNL